ncbi:hypothetical protein O181_100355 [Austropuccinia psidii MF-1]|uniref:Uncharacterized protein n=1 Tax=Austropuccinia psidii MF-1 TaxID=1389203 RepID=A0A9Q3JCL0_9BASI|nr:hypothetical protein [Austropuccinia psidii MF-1]
MAFLGHLGPLRLLWPVGQSGPCWPNQMRPKGQPIWPPRPGGSKPQLDPPEPILAINPLDPILAKNLLDTKMAIEPVGPNFGHGIWKPPEAIRQAQQELPST